MQTMLRLFRYRCIIIRYFILWLFIITMIKLKTIFYYDFQQQTIDSSSLALPHDDSKTTKDKNFNLLNLTTNENNLINRTTIEYNRQYVARKNREQFMYNSNLFSSSTTRYVLLVQVHT